MQLIKHNILSNAEAEKHLERSGTNTHVNILHYYCTLCQLHVHTQGPANLEHALLTELQRYIASGREELPLLTETLPALEAHPQAAGLISFHDRQEGSLQLAPPLMLQLHPLLPPHQDHAAGVLEGQGHSCGELLGSGSCLDSVGMAPLEEEALHEPVAGKAHALGFPLPLQGLHFSFKSEPWVCKHELSTANQLSKPCWAAGD